MPRVDSRWAGAVRAWGVGCAVVAMVACRSGTVHAPAGSGAEPKAAAADRPSLLDDPDVDRAHFDLLPAGVVARSTSGRLLPPMEYSAETRARREKELADAKAKLDAAPNDADALVWYGRRLGYLGRFREAIATFTRGIELHPKDARFWRHRGHRWISLHDFARARADLERSAALVANQPDEVEPAGLPNARGVELDTLKQSVFYHLGLACWLAGDAEAATTAWRECVKHSNNPDALCAVSHWLYCALRELGRADDARAVLAPIRADFDIVENEAYHALLLVYRGEKRADDLLAEVRAKGPSSNDFASVGYGLAHLSIVDGEREKGLALLREVANAPNWAAFGCIAADAELARLAPPQRRRSAR